MKIMIEDKEYIIKFSHISGQATRCEILLYDGWKSVAFAKCSPQDQFSYAKGRKIAFARAILSFPRNLRKKIWQAVWEERKKITKKEWSI